MSTVPQKLLGARLLENGVISRDQLHIALLEQKRNNIHLGRLLVQMGFVTEAMLRDALSETLGRESVDLSHFIADRRALTMVSKEIAVRHKLFPLAFDAAKQLLMLAMVDPDNILALDQIRLLQKQEILIKPLLASETDVIRAIEQCYGFELSIDGILHEIETGEVDYTSFQVTSDEYSQPVVRLINAIISDAVQQSASDIHFEPETTYLRIRYRIDGVLRQIRSLHRNYWPAMIVRLKVMSGMNIAESRSPQDGRISLYLFGRPIDFRVAILPVTHGENIVLRILDRQKGILPLAGLGLEEDTLDQLKIMISRPEGIILVSGPTGSGKTTTLYSILSHINTEAVNIMTLEDPVEYPMALIRQTSVNEAVKIDFANGIRSMMRQDPDIILVGEIRDSETAEMAFSAAMTGHQVFATLHSNNAIGAIPRLINIGIPADILGSNIIGVMAQRLVRRLCLRCKEAYRPDSFERRLLGLSEEEGIPTLYRAVGCEACAHHGYSGRIAIMELLKLNSELEELISRRASTRELREAAANCGFRSLADDATRRVLAGLTSLEEITRVVDLTARVAI